MRKDLFEQLLESIHQAGEIKAGRMKPGRVTTAKDLVQHGPLDPAEVRARYKLSQAKFAALLGISVDTLQNWEQGRRKPDGPAKVLLRIAESHPEALLAVSGGRRRKDSRKAKR